MPAPIATFAPVRRFRWCGRRQMVGMSVGFEHPLHHQPLLVRGGEDAVGSLRSTHAR